MGQTGSAKEHYDNHLGSLYSWMIGDFKTLVHRQKEEFATAGISERSSAVALDLGAGSGVQTVALSDMGYKVTAIDFNRSGFSIVYRQLGRMNILVGQK
jgi:methylase of polypeptide subunit release factors